MFELDRLLSYDDAEIIQEIQRVANLVERAVLTTGQFDRFAKVDSSTVQRRFGGWRQALKAAGLGERYSGRRVSEKMRAQVARTMTNEEIVCELRQVAVKLGADVLTMEAFSKASMTLNAKAVKDRFGSWEKALEEASLKLSPLGRRHSEDDYFENMLTVWTHYGRPPRYGEMNRPPSRITSGAYEHRWGTWSRAKLAFVQRVNADVELATPRISKEPWIRESNRSDASFAEGRSVPLGVRYSVLARDRFRCVICGASPAIELGCRLHVDHITPLARAGKNEMLHLRTLCQECNLGKGSKLETGPNDDPAI